MNILIAEEIVFWAKLDCNVKYIYITFMTTNVGEFRHSCSVDTERKKACTTGR